MNQRKLQSRLQVMSATSLAGKDCKRCIDHMEERKNDAKEGKKVKRWQVTHCHCSFMVPDVELLTKLKSGEPSKKFHAEMKQEEDEKQEEELKQTLDKEASIRDIKREIRLLKKKTSEKNVQTILENSKSKEIGSSQSGGKKRKPIEKISENEKRKKETPLSFIH